MGSAQVLEYSWLAACFLQGTWALRLWRLGLVRRYPSLVIFLAFGTISSLVGYFLFVHPQFQLSLGLRDISPQLYSWFFVTSQPVTWALYLCLLIEAFNRAVAGYGGLQELSRRATYGIAVTVGLLVVAVVILGSSGNLSVERWVSLWIRSEGSLFLGLIMFCLALAAFLAHFRLSVPGNVRLVFGVFGLYFAGQVLLGAFHTQFGLTFGEVRNNVTFFFYIPCLLAGLLAFSKAGETGPAVARIRWRLDERQEEMLTARLRSLNETLVRVLKS